MPICEFCGSTMSRQDSLIYHQQHVKKCLKRQEELKINQKSLVEKQLEDKIRDLEYKLKIKELENELIIKQLETESLKLKLQTENKNTISIQTNINQTSNSIHQNNFTGNNENSIKNKENKEDEVTIELKKQLEPFEKHIDDIYKNLNEFFSKKEYIMKRGIQSWTNFFETKWIPAILQSVNTKNHICFINYKDKSYININGKIQSENAGKKVYELCYDLIIKNSVKEVMKVYIEIYEKQYNTKFDLEEFLKFANSDDRFSLNQNNRNLRDTINMQNKENTSKQFRSFYKTLETKNVIYLSLQSNNQSLC